MAVGDVVAETVVLVVFIVVNDGLDRDEEKESDGEFTLLLQLLLVLEDPSGAEGVLFCKCEDNNVDTVTFGFTATDFLLT